MPNLSQLKRERMLAFLQKIKDEHRDDDDGTSGLIWVVTSAKMLLKLYREVLLFSIGAVYGLQECS